MDVCVSMCVCVQHKGIIAVHDMKESCSGDEIESMLRVKVIN